MKLKIVCISDVHNKYQKLVIPECDILISAGDYSFTGTPTEVNQFHAWFSLQPGKHKISVQGNHELGVEKDFQLSKQLAQHECPGVHFIDEGLVEIEGLKIWCSAITPEFCDWAWNRNQFDIIRHWKMIPDDINILVTHGPPYGILDQTTYANGDIRPGFLGCPRLLERIKELKDLDLHFFGHIHHPGGQQKHLFGKSFYNAAVCDEMYCPTNPITIVDYEK
jgi:Icc-related predicted phosphoesterase